MKPLSVVLKCSNVLEQSDDLKMFEEFRLGQQKYQLREHLDMLVVSGEMILQKLRDMDYWQRSLHGRNKNELCTFNLEHIIKESRRLLDFNAKNRSIKLQFYMPFQSGLNHDFAEKVETN